MNTFQLDLLPAQHLDRIDSETGRVYIKDDIQYISVTHALSLYYGTEWLDEWKERVGEDKASRISTQAKNRGTAVHSIYERYLLNEDHKKETMPFNLYEFGKVKPYLDRSITKIHGVELKLYSEKLRLAGTCDAFVWWDNTPTILDFKTSKRRKKEEDIESYFLQTTIYSMMIEELYEIHVPQILIIMNVDHEEPLFFMKNTIDYRRKVKKIVESIHANLHQRQI